jgi:hypothetical protein
MIVVRELEHVKVPMLKQTQPYSMLSSDTVSRTMSFETTCWKSMQISSSQGPGGSCESSTHRARGALVVFGSGKKYGFHAKIGVTWSPFALDLLTYTESKYVCGGFLRRVADFRNGDPVKDLNNQGPTACTEPRKRVKEPPGPLHKTRFLTGSWLFGK